MNPEKLHPSLAATLGAKGFDTVKLPVIVRVRAATASRGDVGALSEARPSRSFRLLEAQALSADARLIASLSDDPSVEFIWPDLPVHTWLDRRVPMIQAPRVWDNGFTGAGVRIALVDTGIDASHPDFAGRIVAWRDFVDPDAPGADEPRDPNGHGTHVAGIAAGAGTLGERRFRGVAPEAQLIVARVLDASGNGRTSEVMAGIEWAVDQGAQVINVSLGGPPYPADGSDAFSQLCEAAVAQGAVVCVAAGNLGPNGRTIGAPAAAESVISVGATAAAGSGDWDEVALFSSRGPTADGRIKPDVAFPGVGIVAPRAVGTDLGTAVDEHYTAVSGTSQATPMATGTVALLLQASAELTPADIKARMRRAARALPGVEATCQGAGRGDAHGTFVAAEGVPLDAAPPSPAAPSSQHAGCLPAAATGFVLH